MTEATSFLIAKPVSATGWARWTLASGWLGSYRPSGSANGLEEPSAGLGVAVRIGWPPSPSRTSVMTGVADRNG